MVSRRGEMSEVKRVSYDCRGIYVPGPPAKASMFFVVQSGSLQFKVLSLVSDEE
jgi:hypothetical protein